MKYQAIDSDYIREMKEYDEFVRDKKLMYKGIKYGYFIALFIIILSALFNGNLVLAQGSNDINYTFQNINLYNSTSIEDAESFNIRNQTEFTGDYNATYSFEGETGLRGIETSFIDSIEASYDGASIISEFDGHNEVMYFNTSGAQTTARNDFIHTVDEGFMELWVQTTDSSVPTFYIYLYEGSSIRIKLMINGDQWRVDESTGTWRSLCSAISDVWYHVRIDFDVSTDLFDFTLNGELIESGVLFDSGATMLNRLKLLGEPTVDRDSYFDAIGYGWDGYNATYSFTNEVDGTIDTAIDYIDYANGLNNVTILNYLDGHYKIIDIDADVTGMTTYNAFTTRTSGTIEYWIRTEVPASQLELSVREGTAYRIWTYITGNLFKWRNATNFYSTGITCLADTWYHNKIEFFSNSTYSWYINGATAISNNPMSTDMSVGLSRLYTLDYSGHKFLDGVGYSWDPFYEIGDNLIHYSINDNIVPYSITNTSIQEPDKWEFSFTEDGEAYSGPSPVPFWDEIGAVTESGSGKIVLTCDDDSTKGIGRGDFTVLDGILNITLNLEFQQIYTSEAINYLDIYSADDTLITRLRWFSWSVGAPDFYKSMLSYYNGSDYVNITVVVHKHITTPKTENNFNLFINSGICVLRNETTLLGIFPTISDEKGLSRVNFTVNGGQYCDGETNVYGVHIHSIGIYSNGTSISDDYFSLNWEIGEDWDSNDYSFFKSYVIGNYSISAIGDALVSYTLYPKAYYSEVSRLSVLDWFTGEGAPEEYLYLENCNISIISDEVIVFNYFYIEGIRLVEGINEYTPTFSNENVNTNESYFYVSGNNLYFTMTSNDTDLEYMEITFDIDNIVASNRSLKYSGVKSASSLEAQFKVNYVDSSYNPFELEPDYVNLAVLLPRTKTIDTFGLLISDNDNDVNDTITGFIGSFELLYVPLIATDFVSISFFDALPIVVLVVLIPIALYVGFGRKKEILVPSIIAMSIFGTAVGLIPLWLTFVIGFGCVSYFIMDRRN